MSSRSEILSKIKANKPESLNLPQIDLNVFNEKLNTLNQFKKMVEAVGGNVLTAKSNQDLNSQISNLFPGSKNNYSILKETDSFNTIEIDTITNDRQLEDLDILVLEGIFGVAENGAIWIPDQNIPIRVAPFICKHLVLVIDSSQIVPYLHQAYDQLEGQNFDFGIFISGPSKTADIEQSLVIGAQGALSLTVFLS